VTVSAGPAGSNNDGKTRVLQAIDIVELIGQTVKLKRRGGKYVGLCPFHSEKTGSFTVDPGKQFFYCFGCKSSGNAIDFVMKRDRIEFVEALQQLARQLGIDLPRFGVNKQNTSERQVLLDAHSAACGLFEKLFSHPQLGKAVREYVSQRGFNAESIQKFQIGFAMDSWDAMLRSETMKKFSPQQLATAGLVKSRDGGGFYDTFRNRLMFPIRDEQGRIIAFGGRVMPGSQDPAKYLNSPETPLFLKGRCIYGLDLARQKIVETRTVAVVEGYTDVVMAHQYGATNVVSVLGTAMTEQHVGILRRFADRIVLLFDADTAGDLAVNRAVELFLTQPVEIAIASMPDGVDPDEYLMQHGLEAFEKLLAGAQDALGFKWRQLRRDYGSKDDLTSQQKAVEQYLEVLAGARGSGPVDPIRWGQVIARVSRLTEIPQEQLNRRFKASARKRPTPPPAAAAQVSEPQEPNNSAPSVRLLTAEDRAENWVLGVILAQPNRWSHVQQAVTPQDFTNDLRRQLAEIYWAHQRDEGEPEFNELLGMLGDPALKDLAIELLGAVEAMTDLDQTLSDGLSHMQSMRRRTDERKLLAELKRTSDSTRSDTDEIELLRRLQERARQPDIRRTAT
jgi:DNA primase